MYLKKIEVKNFRLWKDTNIDLEQDSTVIVGKNNTGKTSFMVLMNLLISNSKIKFDDYPLDERGELYSKIEAYEKQEINFEELRASFKLPIIRMYIDYSLENNEDSLGALSPFIIDTDDSITTALIEANYSFICTQVEFDNLFITYKSAGEEVKHDVLDKILLNEFQSMIKLSFSAVNPSKIAKKRIIEYKEFKNLFSIYNISAERALDESDEGNKKTLSPLVQKIFQPKLDESFQKIQPKIDELLKICSETNTVTENKINILLKDILEHSLEFGYPSSEDLEMIAKSNIDIKKDIQGSVDLYYKFADSNYYLPDDYNGLGYKNLIKIEFQLLEMSNKIKEVVLNSIPIIFIEEPESHMHPQLQQKFIEHIDNYCSKILDTKKIQTIITTHSSHIVNSTNFEKIRYLTKNSASVFVKNLNDFCKSENNNKDFLQKYLTLNKCDLFFADKAILIEGTAERLLIPDMINKLSKKGDFTGVTRPSLESQYYTLIEVGGAYAFRFIPFMQFLEIPTLIITDIDAIDDNRKACLVCEGTKTSNATIKNWFKTMLSRENPDLTDIKSLASNEKTKGKIHIEYQVEENGLCGRSLEEAIKNCNRKLFNLKNPNEKDLKYESYKDGSKTDFSMNLLFAPNKQDYNVPKYIADGLIWLNLQENRR